ncbi:DUF4214 domain-containing protein [Pseudomonas oryzihabitans]|uniref:DUF4214 domain-containing protein n=1 Tax=Pseudomonas oryzihabitans TaxID=47885 RepID=UPI003C6DF26A
MAKRYTAFDRTPDMEGLHGWLGLANERESLAAIVRGFVQSAEFAARYGSLTNTDFVNALYLTVLYGRRRRRRRAQSTGRLAWSMVRPRLDTFIAITKLG